ncbi:Oidioi.mRNA.OKI2018_I69.chr2.g5793.t1.cds [Oikopleura dioica]|uniref:Oidioi.mRNA.OKI2018_I69.chr2.g5793.t1.cds n=1 Tax=Oikopleura dioica TaxID=34765 RepID=A0ABN7T5T1_OIKDI|nr:Oidioi.mRNA.OKI2018_I69.chr2.g5793.t1.cds [Oikopleura dioica]
MRTRSKTNENMRDRERWSTPKNRETDLQERRSRTVKRRRIIPVKSVTRDSSDENSDTIGETLESTNDHRTQSVNQQVHLSEDEDDVSSIMNSSGDDETLPKPGVANNETFDVPREEENSDARSDKAVIIKKPRNRTVRAKRSVPVYDVMRDSSADSIHDYYQHSDSSQENLIKSKARKFHEKSNRSFDRRNNSSSKNLTFDDLFNDPIVPNSTFPSAKKKPLSTKNGMIDLTKSKKPRKSEQWSPVPLAQMRGLRNESQHFRLRRNRKNVFSETAPVEPTQNRKSIGDSTRTIVRGCADSQFASSPNSKTRTIVKGNKTRTIMRGVDQTESQSKTRTIYRASNGADRTSPSKTVTLVRAGEGNPTIVKEAAANRSLDFEEESSSKTRTLVRASNKTHTIVRGRKSQSAPDDSAHETEVTRGKRRIARKPAPKAQPKLPEVQNWRDLLEESAESSSSSSESETESDDELLEQLVQSTKNAMTLQSFIKDVQAIINPSAEEPAPHIFSPDTYTT